MKPTAITAIALAFTMVLTSSEVMAHGDEKHDHTAKHGGQFVEVEGHHGIELVVSDAELIFHMTEGDNPADLAGASFRAIVQTADGTKVHPLTVDASTLKSKLEKPLPAGSKIVISGKDGHGHALQARFVTK